MAVLTPEAPLAGSPRRVARNTLTAAALVVMCVVVAAAWYLTMSPAGADRDSSYPNARAMAERVGCASTFTAVPDGGGSDSAGRCTTAVGAQVEFRVYPTMAGAAGWLDGARGRATGLLTIEVGGVGSNWAVLVSGNDDLGLKDVNPILQALS